MENIFMLMAMFLEFSVLLRRNKYFHWYLFTSESAESDTKEHTKTEVRRNINGALTTQEQTIVVQAYYMYVYQLFHLFTIELSNYRTCSN